MTPVPFLPDDEVSDAAAGGVDQRLEALLEEVEAEPAPERLLELARRLQDELKLRRQLRRPN